MAVRNSSIPFLGLDDGHPSSDILEVEYSEMAIQLYIAILNYKEENKCTITKTTVPTTKTT